MEIFSHHIYDSNGGLRKISPLGIFFHIYLFDYLRESRGEKGVVLLSCFVTS